VATVSDELATGTDLGDALVELRRRERQQTAVAELGRSALTGTPFEQLAAQAVAAARDGRPIPPTPQY
jgi:hypothetical protein